MEQSAATFIIIHHHDQDRLEIRQKGQDAYPRKRSPLHRELVSQQGKTSECLGIAEAKLLRLDLVFFDFPRAWRFGRPVSGAASRGSATLANHVGC